MYLEQAIYYDNGYYIIQIHVQCTYELSLNWVPHNFGPPVGELSAQLEISSHTISANPRLSYRLSLKLGMLKKISINSDTWSRRKLKENYLTGSVSD